MEEVCKLCNGTGYRYIDEYTIAECICSFSARMKIHLGKEIASALSLGASPLYKQERGKPLPTVDLTSKNLFLKGYWQQILPHIKYALWGKGSQFTFRVVTDERLKSVFMGNESFKTRSQEERGEDDKTHNSLGDLIGGDSDLVIIRLGFLGWKNRAMPGVLKEALMLREGLSKPTWLVEVPSSPFCDGNFSYSIDVASYIQENYKVLELGDKPAEERIEYHGGSWTPGAEAADEDDGTITMGPSKAATPARVPTSRFSGRDDVTSDPQLREGWKHGGKKPSYNKGKGGGPV